MTDRLNELKAGQFLSRNTTALDLEAGVDDESHRLLEKFNKEIAAIDRVIVWSNGVIKQAASTTINNNITKEDTAQRTQDLNDVEAKMKSVRRRLKNLAAENKVFSAEHHSRPATVRTRIVRYTKTSNDFIALTGKLSAAWEAHRVVVSSGMKRDIMEVANPGVSEREVDSAIRSGQQAQLDHVLENTSSTEAARHQLEDIRARNRDLQHLMANVAELNEAFQEISILVETQQDLINQVEFNIEDTKKDAKKTGDELVIARNYQKRNRKIKIICAIVLIIILLIVLAIVLSKVIK